MKYQVTKAFPYFIQRWIFFNKNATLEPLYHFDTNSDQNRIDEMHANDRARAARKLNQSGSDERIEVLDGASNEISEKN